MAVEASPVVWAPKAKQDLLAVWRYYARVASPDVADKLLRDISQAGEALATRPTIWRTRDDVFPGLRSVNVPPYILFYRLAEQRVEIARVLHERRNLAAAVEKRER